MMRGLWGATLMALWAVTSAQARAQDSTVTVTATHDKAAAEALFDEARSLMASGQYARACPKLEASQAMDPGVGTQLNLADCYEKSGKTASAWAQFRETISAARAAGSPERERVARQRVQELEAKLSYLTLVTWKGQDVIVSRDGVALDAAVLGTAIPVDPGVHVVSASADGKRSWSTKVTVGEHADHVALSIPILANELPAEVSVTDSRSQPTAAAFTHGPNTQRGAVQRIMAIVVAAVGVAGAATGGMFGIMATSNWSEAKASCHPYPYCGEAGQKLAKDAAQSGTISTIAFVAGGVGLVSGGLLWLTAPSARGESVPRAGLGLGPGAVTLLGRF